MKRAALAPVLSVLFASVVWTQTAGADGSPFDGKWREGPLKEEYTVQQWLPATASGGCGPAPVSSTLGGGDVVTIHQDGDELTVSGGGRTFKTNQCYDPLPTLVRDTHSRDPQQRSWRTRCTTPPSDPRRATMNTLVVATSDSHIDVLETGRYEIQLAEGRCIADVKRSRTFDLVARDAPVPQPAPPAPVATAVAPPPTAATHENACASPGDPARLEVRPSRKLLRTGESFAFRAVVLDENGCATGAPTSWSVAQGSASGVSVDASGRVTASADAPEGSATIVASAGGRSARVTVDVASPAHYDDLLVKEGLNSAGENDSASIAELATGSIGGGDAKAEDLAKTRRNWFLAIVGVLAAVLGVLAIVFARRTKKAELAEKKAEQQYEERVRDAAERRAKKRAAHEAQVRAHAESIRRAAEQAKEDARKAQEAAARAQAAGAATVLSQGDAPPAAMICTTCRREYPATSVFCPQDATKLVPLNTGAGPLPGAGSICPACKRGYPAGVRVCPQDGEELVPYAMHAAVPRPGTGTIAIVGPTGRAKICPTCGGRFDGNAAFCGKDGTALVLIN